MAGLWNLSFQQLHDLNGNPYPGAKAYFYAADSLTPLTVYQDYGLGTAHPNPVEADAYGVFPAVFFDETDDFYRQRITTQGGVIIGRTDLTVCPIIGPSGGGGGSEVPVDANAIFQTGDVMWLDVSGTRAGWVRDNGRTIGSATSGASERANSDCESLYLFGWAAGWSVVGSAGANAAADWAANKPITLPDKRGRSPFGLDDMGNSAASKFTGITFTTGDATTAGSLGGAARNSILQTHIPSYNLTASNLTVSGTINPNIGGSGLFQVAKTDQPGLPGSSGGARIVDAVPTATFSLTAAGSIPSGGSGTSLPTIPPFVLGTFYRKL